MITFDFLSSLTKQFRQLYSNLLPIPCRLCGQASSLIICRPCCDDLPRLGRCCPRCAVPLSDNHYCGYCLNNRPEQDLSFSLLHYHDPVDRLIAD